MPSVAGILEIVDWTWYDSVGLPRLNPDAEASPVELFTDPLGNMGRHPVSGRFESKTEIETNMMYPKSLPAPHKFLVYSIRAALIGLDGELLSVGTHSRFYRSIVLRFFINSKPYCELPLWKVADPAVLFAEPRTFLDICKELSTPERKDLIRFLRQEFHFPVEITHGEYFWCELRFDQTVRWDGPTAPAGVVVLLEGQNGRAVQ